MPHERVFIKQGSDHIHYFILFLKAVSSHISRNVIHKISSEDLEFLLK